MSVRRVFIPGEKIMSEGIIEETRTYREREGVAVAMSGADAGGVAVAMSGASATAAPADVDACEERKLGTSPVVRLFLQYSAISLLGVLAQIAMVVMEGVVVGNGIGEFGLACMSVVMTFEIINMSFGSSLGQGVSTVCGNLLGAGDDEGARRAFGQGFWFTFFLASAVGATLFVAAPVILPYIGATPDIYEECVFAVRIFVSAYPLCITGQMLCQMLRQDEHPGLASGIQTAGSVIATVWLWTSVFVFKLGVPGAAGYYAISTGTWFIAVVPFIKKSHNPNRSFRISPRDLAISPRLVWDVCRFGCPVFLVQLSSAVYVMVMNSILGMSGDTAGVASFAIINSYFMYTLNIICMAFAYALQPIAAYNEGARHGGRLAKLMVGALVVEVIGIGLISMATNSLAPQMCLIFTGGDAALADMSASHVRVVLMLCALGFAGQIMSAYFESIGRTAKAVLFGVMRYTLFAVPAILVIAQVWGIDHIWYALPVADAATFIITLCFVVLEYRYLKSDAYSS